MKLTHFSLFTGIGGIDLAAEWAGFTTVGQCEFADYPTKVLEKHWPNVPRWRDVRDVTAESVRKRGIGEITLLSGGFPCQPFSVAGKQKGKGDDRYLWPEMLRAIRELAPRWIVGENVPGILRIAGRTVCEDLEREGYAVTVFNFEAAAVGALHRRERVFFVANAKRPEWRKSESNKHEPDGDYAGWTEAPSRVGTSSKDGRATIMAYANGQSGAERKKQSMERPPLQASRFGECSENVANTYNQRLQGRISEVMPECSGERTIGESSTSLPDANKQHGNSSGYGTGEILRERESPRLCIDPRWWTIEPDVDRVAHGIPARVDRLKCLGNAVVPAQIYPILRAIAEIERGVAV